MQSTNMQQLITSTHGITFYHTNNPVSMAKRGIGDVSRAKQEEMSISMQQDLQLIMHQLLIT